MGSKELVVEVQEPIAGLRCGLAEDFVEAGLPGGEEGFWAGEDAAKRLEGGGGGEGLCAWPL